MFLHPKKNIIIKKKYKPNKKILNYNANFTKYNFGILACSFNIVSLRQLETLRKYISRRLNKKSLRFFRLSISNSLFKKSSKARMGKGKGKFYKWFGCIRPGMLLFEFISYITTSLIVFKRFRTINSKLPFKCKLITQNIFFKF